MPRRLRRTPSSRDAVGAVACANFPWRWRRFRGVRDGTGAKGPTVTWHPRGHALAVVIPMIEIRRILCPVDFSDPSLRALQHASALAGWYESALTALYVDTELPIDNAADVGAFGVAPTAVLQATRTTRVVGD